MRSRYQVAVVLIIFSTAAFAGDWIEFTDETASRIIADSLLGANDTKEKDYAWGDVDRDGDIDLVVVRKEMDTNAIGYRNVLFMLEGTDDGQAVNGVLVDRTTEYIPQFLDITNDRDVALVDLDGDGWLDLVTVTACNGCKPSPELLPRIYMNQGEERGTWQGFVWEPARMPSFPITPNFCAVGYGDVTGDGAADLYLTDYFNSLEDRLLINNGDGFFTDQTSSRVSPWLTTSEFSAHAVIADLNNDGYNDIIKNSALEPYQLRLGYNDPENVGFFTSLPANGQVLCTCSNYFVQVGDLNNDGLLDVVELDDAADRYFLNQGNDPDGQVNWISFVLPNSNNGFDENTVIADLDNDGFNDILVADVGVDGATCVRRMDIHHDLGNPPFVTFEEDVGNLPTEDGGPLRGTHDVAVFDLDGNCWLDLVIGTCAGTTVWINQGKGNICDTTTTPDDFIAFRGFYDSGDLDSVLESDDDKLCYNPGIVLNPTEAPVTLDFFGTLPNESPASLDVTIESSANTVGLELTFSFWNFNTSMWDVVGTDTQSLIVDTVRTFSGTPADHVEPGTGEVRTRYEVRVVSFIFLFPWLDCVDHVYWTTTG